MHHPLKYSARVALLSLLVLLGWASGVAAQRPADAALDRMAKQLLPRVEALSGLEARRPINVARRSRAELRAFLQARLQEEEIAGQLHAVERVYKRLALIPDTLDLRSFSAALLTEQIAGYYDPRRDTLYVLEDVPPAELRPILVHEMVHALQNQHAPLDSLLSQHAHNDRQIAARAAIEGHATLVMVLFAFEEATGQRVPLGELPDMSQVPMELLFPDRQLPKLAAAPLILREGSIFPYTRGVGFVQALWRREPGVAPFGSRLPLSTEQVLDPERRFFGQRDTPVELVFEEPNRPAGQDVEAPSADSSAETAAGTGWRTVYENTLGQFELSILLKQCHFLVGSEKYAQGWAGDRYRLLSDGTHEALVWYVAWDDALAAFEFAQAYRAIANARLGRSASVEELTIEGRGVVRIVEADEGVALATVPRVGVRLE